MQRNDLNSTQKQMIEAILKFYLDDINALEPQAAINALQVLFDPSFSAEDIDASVLDSVEDIRRILFHPCPQNRVENYPYFGPPSDPNIVVYKNVNGDKAFEQKGLLNLTGYNDTTAQPVTREAVVDYIYELCNASILNHKCMLPQDQQSSVADNIIGLGDKLTDCIGEMAEDDGVETTLSDIALLRQLPHYDILMQKAISHVNRCFTNEYDHNPNQRSYSSSYGIFSNQFRLNAAMLHALAELDGKLTVEHLKARFYSPQAQAAFTQTHSDALIYLVKELDFSPLDALLRVSSSSVEEIKRDILPSTSLSSEID